MTEYIPSHGRLHAIAGGLLDLDDCVALMGVISAETYYPDYSPARNAISDLARPARRAP